jgi:3-isopropylmalate/(R)-2-methylmalate dehydratase small subunit
MTPFTQHTGIACPLGLANVDTDQLIPARFLKLKRSDGLGKTLLADQRFKDGIEDPSFPLNHPAWRAATVLVARRNFGSGSSREAAVYALADYGIRVVLAPSFGDIFASNAVKNGLLAGVLAEEVTEELLAALTAKPDLLVSVDLAALTVAWGNRCAPFAIDPAWRDQLLNGWDDLAVTRSKAEEIAAYKARDLDARPWARPGSGIDGPGIDGSGTGGDQRAGARGGDAA